MWFLVYFIQLGYSRLRNSEYLFLIYYFNCKGYKVFIDNKPVCCETRAGFS